MSDFGIAIGFGAGGAAIGAGIAAIGAGLGLGRAAAGMSEAIARQPNAAKEIRGGALLLAFLVEGVALFACVIAFLGNAGITSGIQAATDSEIRVMERADEIERGEDVGLPPAD